MLRYNRNRFLLLVGKHPNMKAVVVGEVERLIYRQNISSKAQYVSHCCVPFEIKFLELYDFLYHFMPIKTNNTI